MNRESRKKAKCAYNVAITLAWENHHKAINAAQAAYDKATASAWAAYDAEKDLADVIYYKTVRIG